MAVKQKKTKHAKGNNELLESPEALAERLTRSEEFLEKNKKVVFGVRRIAGADYCRIFRI